MRAPRWKFRKGLCALCLQLPRRSFKVLEVSKKDYEICTNCPIPPSFPTMMPAGSQQLQNILFGAAALFLLYEIWRGWQFGIVRGLLRLVALFCAWVGGSAAASATGTVLTFFSKVPPLLAPAVAALVVGLGIYIVISFLAGLLFKRTEHHEGMVRFFFGLGGMVCGAIFGLLILSGAISLIRGLGALGALRIVQEQTDARAEGRLPAPDKKEHFLIQLRASLELGTIGQQLKQIDPLPTAFYDDIVKFSRLYSDPQAMQRFLQYPATERLLANPKLAALLQDPALLRIAQSHNYLPLLQNRQFLALLEDPQILNELKTFDFTAGLDFALAPQPAASPSPVPALHVHPGKYRRPVSPNSPLAPAHATNALSPNQTAP